MLRDENGRGNEDGERDDQGRRPDAAAPWVEVARVIGSDIYLRNTDRPTIGSQFSGRLEAQLAREAPTLQESGPLGNRLGTDMSITGSSAGIPLGPRRNRRLLPLLPSKEENAFDRRAQQCRNSVVQPSSGP
jgi:hypothetical protein